MNRVAASPLLFKAAALLVLLAACGPAPEGARVPPVTAAPASATAPTATAAKAAGYAGHGADSVPPAVLARFAPPPLPAEVSRRIQAMLDVRAPVGSRLSPDGKTLFFAWNVTGTLQIWRTDGPKKFPVQITGGEDVTRLAEITPDGKWLVVTRDRKGEENPGLYLISTGAPPGAALETIQHLPKVQTHLQFVSEDGKWIYFRANDQKPDAYAVYRYEIATRKKELVFGEDGLWSVADQRVQKGNRTLLLAKATGALTSEIWEWDEGAKKLTPVFGQGEKTEYRAAYASTPGEVVVSTPKFGDFRRLYRAKPTGKTLELADVTAITPDAKHDVSSFHFDEPRKVLYYTTNERGYTRPHALDGKTYGDKKLPEIATVPGVAEDHVSFGAASWDGRWVVVHASAARHPTTSFVLDWQTQKLTQWVTPSTPEIDTSKFAVATLESYPARDGTPIPMFVRRPESCARGAGDQRDPCPVVVHFHGGPEGQSMAGFSTYGQVFVDAGFIWVEPNVRGSDGYGKQWLDADNGPKRLSVITDIEDAAKYVRTAFAVSGKTPKVGVMGGSYGGYSTLVAMTKFAGAFDAGVANVGMSNLLTFLLNTAPYRRALRASEYGDPEKDRAALLELSPITYIDKVNAPLLLIQGATDPRVPIGEAIQMHAALEKKGATTKMIVFPDEGHGTQKRENKVLEIGHTLDWFEVHLKGKSAAP
ncbi:MAG: S9 family peptidase [Labilithrix sp.]|nr:S9 family peptidase [Labilithrix sp.]